MMDVLSLLQEFMGLTMMLVTKPFSVSIWVLLFGIRTAFIVVQTWLELLKASISVHLNLIWRTVVCIIAVVSLPFRVLTALQRESLLEQNLHEMQLELENLLWERKNLEDHLRAATRERRIMESMFEELEDEHEKAITKVEQLEAELRNQKDETCQLREIWDKECWSFAGHNTANGKRVAAADSYDIPYGIPSCDVIFQDMTKSKETLESDRKCNAEHPPYSRTGFTVGGLINLLTGVTTPQNLETNEVYDQTRGVAISQSIFTAVLSLLVGTTIWQAEDHCMPLVVALFTVVGISLRSVFQLFSTIKNKPASDAVALLSFNCFILGTLTYPTLPKVARVLAPLAFHFVDRTLDWFGIPSKQ